MDSLSPYCSHCTHRVFAFIFPLILLFHSWGTHRRRVLGLRKKRVLCTWYLPDPRVSCVCFEHHHPTLFAAPECDHCSVLFCSDGLLLHPIQQRATFVYFCLHYDPSSHLAEKNPSPRPSPSSCAPSPSPHPPSPLYSLFLGGPSSAE